MKRIAIIGATGVIGTALLDKCIEHDIETYVFVRPNSQRRDRLPDHKLIHIISCGMEGLKEWDATPIPPIDIFYYFAWAGTFGAEARNNIDVQMANIQFTIEAVRLSYRLKCSTFVFAGTQAEYGRVEGVIRPDTECNPENGYGIAKYCAEKMSRIECHKLGIRHVTGRVLCVYGQRDRDIY